MRIFCKGFNLYNQLNGPDTCIAEFQPYIKVDCMDSLELKNSFSLILSKNIIHIFCKFVTKDQLEYNQINIKQISANDNIIVALTDSGELYKTSIEDLDRIQKLPKFTNSDKIKLIKCGDKLTIAYTENGFLYSIPEKLDFKNENIVDIQTGREHCLMLDLSGNIYTFGRGSRGQLGHGQLDDEQNPRQVEALAGIKISKIAAGGWHSAAVSQDGDLYTWGWNGNGQLGLSSLPNKKEKNVVSVMATPHIVDIQGSLNNHIIQVACGNKHTIALLDNSYLVGCGWNKYKQLKNEEEENYYAFIFLRDFSDECVQNVRCGPWNSAVLCNN